MSQAQEEEIRQLHERLKVVQAEKATESARAAALQVALFEASMKTRQVLDACKRDAVEVAVEEAVKHHYMARAEMDELVGNIAQDRTKLLSVQGSLLDLQARATKYATTLTDCTIRSISEPRASGDGRKDYHGDGIAPIIERGGENAHANGCTEGSSFQESEALIPALEGMVRAQYLLASHRGIGAAISDQLGNQGYTVIGTATSVSGAEKIDQRFKEQSINGAGMVLNVTDSQSIIDLLDQVVEKFGAPTILINNAGITKDNLLLRMKDDEWFDVIDTNLSSIFRLSKACLKPMTRARWGRIVNISSVVGSMGNGGQTNYSATKAGVAGFARSLAKEIGSRGITVNTVAPGFIATDMTKDLTDANKETMLSQVPLGRLGDPSEIASVVCFLVSNSAGYITGETIHVNGGMYMA